MQGNSGATLGQLELYTYQPGTASFSGIDVGTVGSNLTFLGCADILGNGSSQMMMQQNNGDLWLYTYNPSLNTFSGQEVGAVGSNFHVVGFGQFGTSGQDEMLMQDAAGDFEVYKYNPSENAFDGSSMGAVGPAWTVVGIAADPPGGSALPPAVRPHNSSRRWRRWEVARRSAPRAGPTAGAELSQPTLLTTPHPA